MTATSLYVQLASGLRLQDNIQELLNDRGAIPAGSTFDCEGSYQCCYCLTLRWSSAITPTMKIFVQASKLLEDNVFEYLGSKSARPMSQVICVRTLARLMLKMGAPAPAEYLVRPRL